MNPLETYRHMSTLDTDLVVVRVVDLGETLMIRGYLVHRMFDYAYDLEDYIIHKGELWKWKHV